MARGRGDRRLGFRAALIVALILPLVSLASIATMNWLGLAIHQMSVTGLVVALAELGGDSAQIALAMPKVVTGVFKGILLFMLLAGETFNRFHITLRLPRARPSAGGADA